MNLNELNSFIKDYVIFDKSNLAIMLTGEWGQGKTYYVKNILSKYLEKEEIEPIYISLFGEENLDMLAKKLFIQIKTKQMLKKNSHLKIATSLVNTLLSKLNINFSLSSTETIDFYNEFDFDKKLLIFDDLERTNILLKDLMGFINNLTEVDNAKILLVSNENEIVDKPTYIKYKEKTIIETYLYTPKLESILLTIMTSFNNKQLNRLCSHAVMDEIIMLFNTIKNYNLRAFRYACQATSQIFTNDIKSINIEIVKRVFFGNVAFCLKRNNRKATWDSTSDVSYELGTNEYPFFKECFKLMVEHKSEKDILQNIKRDYRNTILYDPKYTAIDNDLMILKGFYKSSENDVKAALNNIEKKLEKDEISHYCYGWIANFLIVIEDILNIDYKKIKELLVDNLKNESEKIKSNNLFSYGYSLESEEQNEKFNELKNKMLNSLNIKSNDIILSPENIIKYMNYEHERFITNNGFMKYVDVYNSIKEFPKYTIDDIRQLRILLSNIYGTFTNIYDYFVDDLTNLKDFKNEIMKINTTEIFDKIQNYQKTGLIEDLEAIINRLS